MISGAIRQLLGTGLRCGKLLLLAKGLSIRDTRLTRRNPARLATFQSLQAEINI